MKNKTIIILIAVLAATFAYVLLPMFHFVFYENRLEKMYITSYESDFCYPRGHVDRKIKWENRIYYATVESCGKPLKILKTH